MSYYTRYSLQVTGTSDPTEVIAQFLEEAGEDAQMALRPDGSSADSVQWQTHESELLEFSELHPELRFTLAGHGEGTYHMPVDLWKKYFVGGKVQRCDAVITYPPFDPEQLT